MNDQTDDDEEQNNDLNKAYEQIQIDKSSMNESEIEKNLDMYDCKNYRGIEEDREKVSYSMRQMKLLGINKEEGKQ